MTGSTNRLFHSSGKTRYAAAGFIFMALALTLILPPAALAGNYWKFTTNMDQARMGHTATLLFNGKVLVVGGVWDLYERPGELYDPATKKWANTIGLPNRPREYHTATLLANGQVLVTGGYGRLGTSPDPARWNKGYLNITELYDPIQDTWIPSGPMRIARYKHAATLLGDSKVLVTGGFNGSISGIKQAEIYSPISGGFQLAGDLQTGRYEHTATLLDDGKVLVAGGRDINGEGLSSAELYDPATGWTLTGPLQQGRCNHTATLLPDGKVLVAGGYKINPDKSVTHLISAELYVPGQQAWIKGGDLHLGVANHTATFIYLSRGLPGVLVAGGNWIDPYHGESRSQFYNISKNIWGIAAPLMHMRNTHTATLLKNGQVLVTGGYYGVTAYPTASCELFTPGVPLMGVLQLFLDSSALP